MRDLVVIGGGIAAARRAQQLGASVTLLAAVLRHPDRLAGAHGRRRPHQPAPALPRRRAAPDRHLQIKFSPGRFWEDAARDGATHGFLLGPLAAMVRKETKVVPEHRLTQGIYCLPSPADRAEWEQ